VWLASRTPRGVCIRLQRGCKNSHLDSRFKKSFTQRYGRDCCKASDTDFGIHRVPPIGADVSQEGVVVWRRRSVTGAGWRLGLWFS
jgi:hypothetical protein